jgi:hypothetical protein
MGLITERKVRNYYGADADKGSIPAVGKTTGDLYFATDTKAVYRWDGAAWVWAAPNLSITAAMLAADSVETLKIKNLNVTKDKAELGFGRYVPLFPGDWDWTTPDFIFDDRYKYDALDLKTKGVPIGAIGVALRLSWYSSSTGTEFEVAYDVMAAGRAIISCQTVIANVYLNQYGIIPVDPGDCLLDYYGTAGVDEAFIAVLGYFI